MKQLLKSDFAYFYEYEEIEDLRRVVISYEIYETSLRRVS